MAVTVGISERQLEVAYSAVAFGVTQAFPNTVRWVVRPASPGVRVERQDPERAAMAKDHSFIELHGICEREKAQRPLWGNRFVSGQPDA